MTSFKNNVRTVTIKHIYVKKFLFIMEKQKGKSMINNMSDDQCVFIMICSFIIVFSIMACIGDKDVPKPQRSSSAKDNVIDDIFCYGGGVIIGFMFLIMMTCAICYFVPENMNLYITKIDKIKTVVK